MKLCERIVNWVQIIDYKGTVRLCGWINDNIVGNLSDNSMEEIFHGRHAEELRKKLACNDYSSCLIDACPYLAMNTINDNLIEIDEIPRYPEKICLAFEEVCNYKCISCTTPMVMQKQKKKKEEVEAGYDVIEEQLNKVLPYVKNISTNGRGEIFASKRILKILSEWKPLAPKEEITVELESNGSLFDEKHWKQIENLGQYNVRVAITVMSFEEDIYQVLSGCQLPIGQIEKNLRFIKELREKGIINYFEIATVVQDRNFRTLPEFARRCVEEFGADYVRLRPYMPWGSQAPHIEWFMDVRNPKHPYYNEYKKVMKNPIFKHPRVHDWSGGHDSAISKEFPYRIDAIKKKIILEALENSELFLSKIGLDKSTSFVIYGLGEIGRLVVKIADKQNHQLKYIIDEYSSLKSYEDKFIYKLSELSDIEKDILVIVTPLSDTITIKKVLLDNGYNHIICMADLYF